MRRWLKIMGWMDRGGSTALLVLTLAMWARSLGHCERWAVQRFEPEPRWTMPDLAGWGTQRGWGVEATDGRLVIGWTVGAPWPPTASRSEHQRTALPPWDARTRIDWILAGGEHAALDGEERSGRFAGAGFWHGRDAVDPRTGRPFYRGVTLMFPFWMLAIVFGLWPALSVAHRLLRKKRFAAGLCQHCGYDLRATPDRCPECGRTASSG